MSLSTHSPVLSRRIARASTRPIDLRLDDQWRVRESLQIATGVMERIGAQAPYTVERLQAAIERVARILGQDLTHQNPILNTRLPDGSRVAVVGAPSSIHGPTLTVRKFNRWYSSEDELVQSGSLPTPGSGHGCPGLSTKRRTA